MIPGHFLAETRQGLSRLAPRYSVADITVARHGQLEDINITGSELSPQLRVLLVTERQRQSSRKNLCHSENLHVRVPNSTYLKSCSETTTSLYSIYNTERELLIFYRLFLSVRNEKEMTSS